MEHYTTNTTIGLIYMCAFLIVTCSCSPHLSRFTSHVRVTTPAISYSHGVGDPLHASSRISTHWGSSPFHGSYMHQEYPRVPTSEVHFEDHSFQGYPRYRPAIPFHEGNSIVQRQPIVNHRPSIANLGDYRIPVLPASPYKVDSADPESNWPEGFVLAQQIPVRYGASKPYSGYHNRGYESNSIEDPHYLDGWQAVRAVEQLNAHGELFHDEIPHVRAVLSNQQLRAANGLTLNRLGSIRPSSPWFRD